MISFKAAISACGKGGQWKSALLLLCKMREAGMTANVISFNAGISACEKGVQREQSIALLYKMREPGMTALLQYGHLSMRERWAVVGASLGVAPQDS